MDVDMSNGLRQIFTLYNGISHLYNPRIKIRWYHCLKSHPKGCGFFLCLFLGIRALFKAFIRTDSDTSTTGEVNL